MRLKCEIFRKSDLRNISQISFAKYFANLISLLARLRMRNCVAYVSMLHVQGSQAIGRRPGSDEKVLCGAIQVYSYCLLKLARRLHARARRIEQKNEVTQNSFSFEA